MSSIVPEWANGIGIDPMILRVVRLRYPTGHIHGLRELIRHDITNTKSLTELFSLYCGMGPWKMDVAAREGINSVFLSSLDAAFAAKAYELKPTKSTKTPLDRTCCFPPKSKRLTHPVHTRNPYNAKELCSWIRSCNSIAEWEDMWRMTFDTQLTHYSDDELLTVANALHECRVFLTS